MVAASPPVGPSDVGAGGQVVFWAAVVLWLVSEAWILLRPRRVGASQNRTLDRASARVVVGLAVVGMGGAAVAAAHVRGLALPGPGAAWLAGGLGIAATGVALRMWAVRTLGRFFVYTVTIQRDHRVVDTGPYRVVRHPSYTGALITFAGLGLALANGLSLIIAVALPLAAYLYRIPIEERALAERLGEPYARYAAGRARIVPWVW